MELPVSRLMAPYNHYPMSNLTLGPYQMSDTYYLEWFATTTAKPVAEITLKQRARVLTQLKFNQKAYRSYLGPDEEVLIALASDQTVTIPAHLDLISYQIDLRHADPRRSDGLGSGLLPDRFKVIKVGLQSPWALQCESNRNSSLGQFLLLLSQHGKALLDDHAVNYRQYDNFVSGDDHVHDHGLTVRFYGSERINSVLDKYPGRLITDVVIEPRSIWPSESSVEYTNQKVENYHLTMMVRLVSYRLG